MLRRALAYAYRIHELGIAIQTGSGLEDRFFLGQGLVELSNLASEITDEVVMINTMSVSIFSWLFWEVSMRHDCHKWDHWPPHIHSTH